MIKSRKTKQREYLQRLSKKQLEAAQRAKMECEVYYPPERLEISGKIETTINDEIYTLSLIYYGRADSFHIAFNGHQIYWNRAHALVLNQTREPLKLGLSDAHRFLAKQVIRRRYER
jgi:hypothetical protein